MTQDSLSKLADKIGISLLTLLLFLSLAFRASPVTFMNPDFPILSDSDWKPWYAITLSWHEYPKRFISDDKFSEVAYISIFQLQDQTQMFSDPYVPTKTYPIGFSGFQTVIRYSDTKYALAAMQNNYEEYMRDLEPYDLITDIPDLKFSSGADKYYIWCDQLSPDNKTTFDAVDVETCYYWAVYGRYYSEIRFFMWPVGGFPYEFSVELFNDVLDRADKKLLGAQQ
jgi:hypothetical protein